MARLNDFAHGKLDAPKIDPREIIIREGFNFRDTSSESSQKHIAWLKESIRETGVQEPIRVEFTDGRIYLVNGECRVLALRELWNEGEEVYVPAMAVKGDEAEVLAKSMIANGALPPTKLEFGKAAARLLAYGWTKEQIASYTPPHIAQNRSKAARYVTEAVELHQAPLKVKEAVKKGIDGVKVSDAAALAATRGNRMQAGEILEKAAKEAKAKGQTEVKRPKGDGTVTLTKRTEQQRVENLLKLADALADVALDPNLELDEVERCAKAYNKARGR